MMTTVKRVGSAQDPNTAEPFARWRSTANKAITASNFRYIFAFTFIRLISHRERFWLHPITKSCDYKKSGKCENFTWQEENTAWEIISLMLSTGIKQTVNVRLSKDDFKHVEQTYGKTVQKNEILQLPRYHLSSSDFFVFKRNRHE